MNIRFFFSKRPSALVRSRSDEAAVPLVALFPVVLPRSEWPRAFALSLFVCALMLALVYFLLGSARFMAPVQMTDSLQPQFTPPALYLNLQSSAGRLRAEQSTRDTKPLASVNQSSLPTTGARQQPRKSANNTVALVPADSAARPSTNDSTTSAAISASLKEVALRTPTATISGLATDDQIGAHEALKNEPQNDPSAESSKEPSTEPRNELTKTPPATSLARELPSVSAANPRGQYWQLNQFSAPRYPDSARRSALQGAVWVQGEITAQGVPTGLHVVRSSGVAALDRAALESVQRYRFTLRSEQSAAPRQQEHFTQQVIFSLQP